MIVRTSTQTPDPRLSKREARFLDDLLIAGAALGITVATFVVVAVIGV
jgi:hypothetical protein